MSFVPSGTGSAERVPREGALLTTRVWCALNLAV